MDFDYNDRAAKIFEKINSIQVNFKNSRIMSEMKEAIELKTFKMFCITLKMELNKFLKKNKINFYKQAKK